MPLTAAQVADLSRRLEMLRGELAAQLRVVSKATRTPAATRIDMQRREIEILRRLQLVRAAIARLEREAYGLCQRCERPIDYDELQETPEARFCRSCEAHEMLPAASGEKRAEGAQEASASSASASCSSE